MGGSMTLVRFNTNQTKEDSRKAMAGQEPAAGRLAKRGPTILLVNHVEKVSHYLAKGIHLRHERDGKECSLEHTTSGVEALERCKEGGVDLVITGLLPEDMPGLKLIEKIREQGPQTKIIVLSGLSGGDWEQRALEAGAISVFPKPLPDFNAFATRVMELTAHKQD